MKVAKKILRLLKLVDKAVEHQIALDSLMNDMEIVGNFLKGLINREFKLIREEMKKVA